MNSSKYNILLKIQSFHTLFLKFFSRVFAFNTKPYVCKKQQKPGILYSSLTRTFFLFNFLKHVTNHERRNHPLIYQQMLPRAAILLGPYSVNPENNEFFKGSCLKTKTRTEFKQMAVGRSPTLLKTTPTLIW